MNPYCILGRDEAQRQHDRLAGARARVLRAADVHRRERIMELGAGWGFAAAELADRSGRLVTAVDQDEQCVASVKREFPDQVVAVHSDIRDLPPSLGKFDLVFAQFAFLWFGELNLALAAVDRLLDRQGVFVVIEPDFGGMLAWPLDIDIRAIWIDALQRAGADPFVGRRLHAELQAAGFETQVMLCDRLEPFDPVALDALRALPITAQQLEQINAFCASERPLCHLPLFMTIARR